MDPSSEIWDMEHGKLVWMVLCENRDIHGLSWDDLQFVSFMEDFLALEYSKTIFQNHYSKQIKSGRLYYTHMILKLAEFFCSLETS